LREIEQTAERIRFSLGEIANKQFGALQTIGRVFRTRTDSGQADSEIVSAGVQKETSARVQKETVQSE